ncbi:hypothetical protein TIFTF001_033670 [Ficus carica]|uniref:FAR1 domain-containing protein n=1 Tax=Ficus carica TaxID=3494 RepID=A0AA88E167_FICCA|nr:hypothetical protein TIFTF001_033670 [Ficus carica]
MESETAPSDHECGQMLVVPQCGMEFPSEERAYNFYKNYAARLGFKVRKGKVQRTSNGMIQKRIFLCSKEGERSKKISGETPRYKRKETRTGCKAEIRIELKNSKWVIYGCSLEHNHELERPGQRHESDTYPDNSQVSVRESNVDGARVVDKEAGTAENRSSEEVGQRHESDTYPDNSQVAVRESIVDGARVVDTEGGTAENRSPVEVEQDFENEWKILMEDFELQEDPWLATLYKSWEKWSPVFSKVPSDFELFIEFKNPFHVFPSWTPEIATLSDVLDKYLERLQQLRLKELKSDSLTMPRQRRFGMEKHAVGVYTPEVFVDFKLEFEGIMSLAMEESVATEKTRAIVERHLDLALRETAKSLETKFWETDSRGDDVDNDEICCGERHCPFGKRKKIGSTSSSDNEVHESASSSDNEVHGS